MSELTHIMYGKHAIHVPAWFYTQGDGGVVSFVGASSSPALRFGGVKTHQLVVGEIIVRPHYVVESDAFKGHGLPGLATANHHDFLNSEDAKVICDALGILSKDRDPNL
jgi:hypothetical protein